jgi:hypothetical protein
MFEAQQKLEARAEMDKYYNGTLQLSLVVQTAELLERLCGAFLFVMDSAVNHRRLDHGFCREP